MKKRMRSVLSVLLCCCLLFSALCLSVSAADETILVSDMAVTMHRTETVDGVTTWYSYDFTDGNTQIGGKNVHWFKATNPAFYASGGQKITTLFDSGEIAAGHEYEMSFYAGLNFNMRFNIRIFLDGAPIYNHDFSSAGSLAKVNVKFNAPAEITNNAQIQVVMTISENSGYGSDGKNAYFYISENLEFTDLTENPTWLQRILKKFQELGETIGGFFTGLGNRIGGFFTNLSNSISQWFQEQKQQIQDFFNGVKQWFQELGDRISGYFTNLYNDLIEGLKSLFIPAEGYFDAYMQKTKDWAAERFGFLYTAADLMVSMVTDLKGLLRDDYSFVFPAARFTLNGQTYTLWNEYTLPMGEYLQNNYMKFAYGTYKTLLGSVFAFALFKYAQKVFDKVMAN